MDVFNYLDKPKKMVFKTKKSANEYQTKFKKMYGYTPKVYGMIKMPEYNYKTRFIVLIPPGLKKLR